MPYAVTPSQSPGCTKMAGPKVSPSTESVTSPVAPTTPLKIGRRRSHHPITARGERVRVGSGKRTEESAGIRRNRERRQDDAGRPLDCQVLCISKLHLPLPTSTTSHTD